LKPRLLFALGLLAIACGRPRHGKSNDDQPQPGKSDARIVSIDLTSGAPESSGDRLFRLPATRTYTGLVRALDKALDKPETAGLFVSLGNESLDFSRAAELARVAARFRDKKLPVVCHAHDYSNASSWFALRACTRIWVSPAGSYDTVGIAAELVHVKSLLDKLKVGVDFLAIGKYKGGAEPLTHEEPSAATREALSATLASIRNAWLADVELGRPGVKAVLESGPYSANEAKAKHLADEIGYEVDALADAKRLGKTKFVQAGFGPDSASSSGFDIGQLIKLLSGGDDGATTRPHVAVVPAEGAIAMESGGALDSGGITAKSLVRTLKRLKKDDSVKAVVLRIDSPGGSPLASDVIWHELMELRKKKPVVTSVGSMAASGGYYIAAGTQRIFAESASIVGSIGVFGGKIVIGPALHEVGIDAFLIPANPEPAAADRAAYLSPFRMWDDATRERVRAHMKSIYDLFIERVAAGRNMPADTVRASAEGRIYSGVQGKEHGLVDEIGGLARAIEAARGLAGLDADAPVAVEGPRESLIDQLLLGEAASEGDVRAAVAQFERRGELLTQLPASLRAHADSVSPLLAGETAVVALPVAGRHAALSASASRETPCPRASAASRQGRAPRRAAADPTRPPRSSAGTSPPPASRTTPPPATRRRSPARGLRNAPAPRAVPPPARRPRPPPPRAEPCA
jgi:protease-4